MKTIYFVTGNKTKILHANEALNKLGYSVVSRKIDILEPREENPEKVVLEKAVQASKEIQKPLIVEDSGIFIKALSGFPMTFVNFAVATLGIANILKMMEGVEDGSVEFRQSLAYIEPETKEPVVFSYVDGGFTISRKIWKSKDSNTAEFDKILVPPGESKPLCTFSKKWGAERDVRQNKDRIHYHQLARWLEIREK